MADNKRKIVKLKPTPIVALRYPKVFEPDFGTEKYPKEHGEYSAQLIFRLDDPAHRAWLDTLRPLHDAVVERGREEFAKLPKQSREKLKSLTINDLYTTLYDKETEEPTGEVMIKATQRYSYIDKKTGKKKFFSRPGVFDSMKRVVPQTDIWSGTKARVSLSVEEDGYFVTGTGTCGLSFKLGGLQIIELIGPNGQRSADSYGFDEEDGGFDASGIEANDRDLSTGADAGDDGDDGSTDF